MKEKKVPRAHAKRVCILCGKRYVTPNFPVPEGTQYVYIGVCKKCQGH